MLFSKKKKRSKTLTAVFDIGSGSVGGALMLPGEEGSAPKILYTARTPIIFQKELDFDRFIASMVKSLHQVSEDLLSAGLQSAHSHGVADKSIESVACVLSSPWYVAETKVIHMAKKNPITLTERFIKDVVLSEEAIFSDSTEVTYSEKTKRRPSLLEHSIIDVKLNGYTINDPYNKKVSDIEFTIFMSMVSEGVLSSAGSVLRKHFHTDNITFQSSALASFSSIRDIYADIPDFILFDMSAEISDFFLVKNEKLLDNASFPLGTNHLVRAIMDKFNTTPGHATTTLNLISDNKLEEGLRKETEEIIQNVSSDWRKLAGKALSELESKERLPIKIFTLTSPRYVLFADRFIKELWQENGRLSPKIENINPSKLADSLQIMKGVKQDVFLLLYSIYADKTLF